MHTYPGHYFLYPVAKRIQLVPAYQVCNVAVEYPYASIATSGRKFYFEYSFIAVIDRLLR